MKKMFIISCFFLLFLCGCEKTEPNMKVKTVTPDVSPEEVVPAYEDQNQTPIGIYSLNGNTLTKLTTIHKQLKVEEDIGVFQVYPSNEDTIYLDKGFADSYYEKWISYQPVKLGFNISFHLVSGEDVSYNILYPSDCMNRWEHLMNYLYDDYANRGKGFYSHIENDEYNENTLYTAIKIQSSYQVSEIDSAIKLTAFTYDSADDFDENGMYRGNSSYTMTICPSGIDC